MPKDLIHFKIAQRTAKRLADTRYAPHLEQQIDGLLLGSIFHDALFYAVTPKGKPLEKLAHKLHGAEGEDTFALIRLQARHAQTAIHKALPTALLVGLISHLYADVVMHPLVWHLTGNYYDKDPVSKSKARQRHRALESLMDMVTCPEMMGRARYRLRTLLRRCPEILTSGMPIPEIGDMASMLPEMTRAQMDHAWTTYSLFQWIYSATPLARTLFALRKTLPPQLAEIAMLFYPPQLMNQADAIQYQIPFEHPTTGRELIGSLDQFMDNAAGKAAALCRQLEPAIFETKPILLPGPGPSLDAGISRVTTNEMRFFADPPFPLL